MLNWIFYAQLVCRGLKSAKKRNGLLEKLITYHQSINLPIILVICPPPSLNTSNKSRVSHKRLEVSVKHLKTIIILKMYFTVHCACDNTLGLRKNKTKTPTKVGSSINRCTDHLSRHWLQDLVPTWKLILFQGKLLHSWSLLRTDPAGLCWTRLSRWAFRACINLDVSSGLHAPRFRAGWNIPEFNTHDWCQL